MGKVQKKQTGSEKWRSIIVLSLCIIKNNGVKFLEKDGKQEFIDSGKRQGNKINYATADLFSCTEVARLSFKITVNVKRTTSYLSNNSYMY